MAHMSVALQSLNTALTNLELALNVVGYIPFLSTYSGSLRICIGKIELISALAAAAILTIAGANARTENDQRPIECLVYAAHGAGNIARGLIEVFPFLSLLLCLPCDLSLSPNRLMSYPQYRTMRTR